MRKLMKRKPSKLDEMQEQKLLLHGTLHPFSFACCQHNGCKPDMFLHLCPTVPPTLSWESH